MQPERERANPDEFHLSWHADAACGDASADIPNRIFFPGRGKKGRAARRMCSECPVRAEC
jgi:hypothetical protein